MRDTDRPEIISTANARRKSSRRLGSGSHRMKTLEFYHMLQKYLMEGEFLPNCSRRVRSDIRRACDKFIIKGSWANVYAPRVCSGFRSFLR